MDRRRFLKTTSISSVVGAGAPVVAGVVRTSTNSPAEASEIRKPLSSYMADDHRQRLENIAICERGIRSCLRKHLITSYLPGQAYYNLCEYPARKPWEPSEYDDEVLAFEETDQDDGYLTDMLGLIYDLVKRRGGVVKLHRSGTRRPKTTLKVYDYLWVGEGGRNGDRLREAVKNHPPYVVPCLDMSRATIENEDELYLHAIPYLQFPLLSAGRPFTGERAAVPGITYTLDRRDFWSRHYLAIREHYKAHLEGPYSYSQWDSAIPRPKARPTHARWLKRYLPLVEEGTWAWLEIGESKLVAAPLPDNVVVSAFANRQLHLALANYNNAPVELATADVYLSVTEPTTPGSRTWKLPPRSLHILRRQA